MFKGSMVAIVTPFKKKAKEIDEDSLKDLVEFQVKNGTSVIVPCGTTGESATLSMEEHERVIDVVIAAAKGRVKVMAGTGSNSTSEAIELTRHAKIAGADAALIITPYYNKPTQEGVYQHFKALSDEVDIPLVVYNIASRTGVNITADTMKRLAALKNVVGVKEASGDLNQMSEIRSLCGKDFDLISGDDSLTLPILSIGGCGVISVVANIIPKDVSDMVSAFEKNDIETARALHYKMLPVVKAMFIETNPIPVKTAMSMMGMIEPGLRLPMCDMSKTNKDRLSAVLKNYELI
ncbi:MAG: 4-hydroxy-tetrahydrodipicolinate synthase [Candidatus Omnitrophica bacterium]|jgi:4-hydroxy-tetrahydrodipicolinate synthase|nr:4-hydroxy-tetrahydrodipicolinate synthase [Candidatus Omnitrophota bacterium]